MQLSFGYPWTVTSSQEVTGETPTKRCKHCHEEKPDSEFVRADGRHRATRNRCKECSRRQSDVRRRLRSQHPCPPPGNCPVCLHYTAEWVLDHCHYGEAFRGYICQSCNSGIGLLHDDPLIVRRALHYLLDYTNATVADS